MLEVFQPGCLSCAVALTWLVAVGAGKQAAPFTVPRKKRTRRILAQPKECLDEITASRNAALPLPWIQVSTAVIGRGQHFAASWIM